MLKLPILTSCFFFLMLPVSAFTEANIEVYPDSISRKKVYVWDFSVSDISNTKLKGIAVGLTNWFEAELVGIELYTVLERRRYDRVKSAQKFERRILEMDDLSQAVKDTLQAIETEAVFFGEVTHNRTAGLYLVTVKLQSLEGIILKRKDIQIPQIEIEVPRIQNEMMKNLVVNLHETELQKIEELEAIELNKARRSEYAEITRILDTYIIKIENVNNSFQTMGFEEFEFDGQYLKELTENVLDYNKIFEEIKTNHFRIHMSVSSHWKKELSDELYKIFDVILYDIHDQVVFRRLNKVRNEIVTYRKDVSNKKLSNNQKELRKHNLIREITRITSELSSKIRSVDGIKRSFIMKLNSELTQ